MIKTDIKISSHGYEAYFRSDLGGNCYRLYHAPTQSELLRTPKDENELFSEIFYKRLLSQILSISVHDMASISLEKNKKTCYYVIIIKNILRSF